MVFLPVSQETLRSGRDSGASRLSAVIAWGADFLRIFGAARRVAAAVENGRVAHPADLRTLGIRGALPRAS